MQELKVHHLPVEDERGQLVGTDEFGNRYYLSRDNTSYDGRRRRWVVYNGYADGSKVPPDWYGWLHYTVDEPPTERPLPRKSWEKDHLPNLTGTPMAWRPRGSLAAEGVRWTILAPWQAGTDGDEDRVELLAQLVEVGEAAVVGGEADVGDVVQLSQPVHHHIADLGRGHLHGGLS